MMHHHHHQHGATITTLLMCFVMICSVTYAAVFPPTYSYAPNFQKSRLYDSTKYLNLDSIQGRAGCVADVNNDKLYCITLIITCMMSMSTNQ
jgi:hypothetical protein